MVRIMMVKRNTNTPVKKIKICMIYDTDDQKYIMDNHIARLNSIIILKNNLYLIIQKYKKVEVILCLFSFL